MSNTILAICTGVFLLYLVVRLTASFRQTKQITKLAQRMSFTGTCYVEQRMSSQGVENIEFKDYLIAILAKNEIDMLAQNTVLANKSFPKILQVTVANIERNIASLLEESQQTQTSITELLDTKYATTVSAYREDRGITAVQYIVLDEHSPSQTKDVQHYYMQVYREVALFTVNKIQ